MDVIQSRIERGELTFNATLADALAGYGFTFDPNRKTAVAALMCFADAESGNAFTADNPKLYGELDALFNQALPLYAFRKNRTRDAKKNAAQFKLEKRADAILRTPLRMFYGIEETAQAPAVTFNPAFQRAQFAAVVDGERKHTEREIIKCVKEVIAPVADAVESAAADAAWLKADREGKQAENKRRGTINQANGNTDENERAARDMATALQRVHDNADVRAGKHGALTRECRRVCKKFTPRGRKDEYGAFSEYDPLTGADGEAIQPETLAKNYREAYGTINKRKANATKNQARTQAARDAKTRRTK